MKFPQDFNINIYGDLKELQKDIEEAVQRALEDEETEFISECGGVRITKMESGNLFVDVSPIRYTYRTMWK